MSEHMNRLIYNIIKADAWYAVSNNYRFVMLASGKLTCQPAGGIDQIWTQYNT